jgi:hypothetical protein
MDHKQTIAMLTWINQVDPRVMLNEASVETWAYSMAPVEVGEAKQAVLEHYKANEAIAANPATIRKRALNIRASRDAFARAQSLEAPKPVKHPLSWRARNPEEWDRLFEEGRRQGNEERRRATEARQGPSEPDHSGWMAA